MQWSEASKRAAEYVQQRGDAFARRRATALLGAADPAPLVAELAPSPVDAAALREALGLCDDLRALDAPPVRGWCEAARALQGPDGGWCPEQPLEVRRFETGMIAGCLAKSRHVRPGVLDAAGDFLARHWSPELVRAGSWRAICAHAHFFANADHEQADAVLQWCGRELGRAFLTRHFDAVRTARVLVCCDAHGLPGAELRREELVLALVTEQAPDGSFPAWSGEGARDALGSTLDGLLALQRLGG